MTRWPYLGLPYGDLPPFIRDRYAIDSRGRLCLPLGVERAAEDLSYGHAHRTIDELAEHTTT